VRDLGGEPVFAGGLARARLLEATAAFAIGVWVSGGDVRTLFPPMAAAFGEVRPGD
jgi:predicted dinucleotide-binding enzyme